MTTWNLDIVQALKNLNGCGHLIEIYKEVKSLRKLALNPTWDATIRRELETNPNQFFSVEGKGKGIWGLTSYKNRFYWVSQNRTFKVERRDGFYWAPYLDKKKNKVFHWETLKQLKKGDVVFSHFKGTIPCISIVKDKAIEKTPRTREFPKSLPWMEEGRRVNAEYVDINPIILNKNIIKKLNTYKTKNYWIYDNNLRHNVVYMLPLPLQAAKFLLDRIQEKNKKITIEDVENFDENKSETIESIKNRSIKRTGQGFGLSKVERDAIENHAMNSVIQKYKKDKWIVTDVSKRKNKGYDLNLKKDSRELFCEVKGTTGLGHKIIITKNEVLRAQNNYPKYILCVVSGIWLDRSKKPPKASLGKIEELNPWKIENERLEPINYFYKIRD